MVSSFRFQGDLRKPVFKIDGQGRPFSLCCEVDNINVLYGLENTLSKIWINSHTASQMAHSPSSRRPSVRRCRCSVINARIVGFTFRPVHLEPGGICADGLVIVSMEGDQVGALGGQLSRF